MQLRENKSDVYSGGVSSPKWACGAAGSALPWHGRGRRFDPDQVHQISQRLPVEMTHPLDGRDARRSTYVSGVLFFLVLFLDFGPGIFQRHGAVEHWTSGRRIWVHAKISEAFELVAAFDRRVRERRLQL